MQKLTTLGVIAALTVGCATATPKLAKAGRDRQATTTQSQREILSDLEKNPYQATEIANEDSRQVGDYVSFAFSGAFAKNKFVLTQRVVEKTRENISILFERNEDGKVRERLLVESRANGSERGRVVSVVRVDDEGNKSPASAAAYEALLAKTVPATDSNDGLLHSEDTTVQIGSTTLPATKFEYAVQVKGTKAKMSAYSSDEFAWGDLGGEIKADSGKLLYKAEIVEIGSAARETASLPQ